MFFNSKEKDEKIAKLEARVKELESQLSSEETILNEIDEVLTKAAKGLCGINIQGKTSNPKIDNIINNINNTLKYYQVNGDKAVDVLINYGKANFSHEIDTNGLSGKLGSVILGIRALGGSISELLALMDNTAKELNSQTEQLKSTSINLAKSSKEQAVRLEETASSLEEVTSTVINNSQNTTKMSEYANGVIESAKIGQDMSNETDKAMDDINAQVSAINEAISVIDQIAFQTNILSLNAAVEAATAGEAGKGFAVVAGEVRSLAGRSAEAAKDIKELVELATLKTQTGKEVAYKMTLGYEKLYDNINNTIELINSVSNASIEQRGAIEQINDSISYLDKVTQENASSSATINTQSEKIYSLSEKLLNTVSKTSYNQSYKNQVCDIDQIFTLNSLKLDHINFKDTNLARLNEKSKFTVKTSHDCELGKWIDKQERENKEFTKTSNWKNLKEVHKNVHSSVQEIVNSNSMGDTQKVLSNAQEIDKAISDVFISIQELKKDHCKTLNNKTNNSEEIIEEKDDWSSF